MKTRFSRSFFVKIKRLYNVKSSFTYSRDIHEWTNNIRLRIISLGLCNSSGYTLPVISIRLCWMRPASRGGEEPSTIGVNNMDYASPRPLTTLHGRRRPRYRRQRVIRVRSENPFSNGISSETQKARQEIVGYVTSGRWGMKDLRR